MDIKEKWLRKQAEKMIPFFKKANIPAEFLTIFRIIFALIVALIFLKNNYILSVIFLTIYQFIFLLDYIDGKLARYQKRFSILWVKIDRFSHYFISFAFILTLSISYFLLTKNIFLLSIGILGSFFIFILSIISIPSFKKSSRRNLNTPSKLLKIYSYIGIDNPFGIFYLLMLLNLKSIVIIIYSFLYSIIFIKKIKNEI